MTPSQVLHFLTQDQTHDLLVACAECLPIDRIEHALRLGLESLERRQLAYQLSIEFDLEGSQDSESS
jgi:hypothetical protein